MKFALFLAVLMGTSWVAHSIGYKNGLKASPAYAASKERELNLRETEFADFQKRAYEYSLPTINECLPVVEQFDGDIGQLCVDLYMQDENERDSGENRDPDHRGR